MGSSAASYDWDVNKVLNLTFKWTAGGSAVLMMGGLVTIITVLAAGAALAQARGPAGNLVGPAVQGSALSRVDNGVSRASMAGDVGRAELSDGGIAPASMSGRWVGPVTQDERRHRPRKLTAEERNLLRQEIRSASEEVYEPYRRKVP